MKWYSNIVKNAIKGYASTLAGLIVIGGAVYSIFHPELGVTWEIAGVAIGIGTTLILGIKK